MSNMAGFSSLDDNSIEASIQGGHTPSDKENTLKQSMIDCLKRDIIKKPGNEIFTFVSNDGKSDEIYSYRELEKLITQFSSVIDTLKVRQDVDSQDKAIILLPPGKYFVSAFYACLAAGVIAVPSFPPQNALHFERLNIALNDLDNPIIICDKKNYETVNQESSIENFRAVIVEECLQQGGGSLLDYAPKGEDIAMLQYSSGSTGRPKGVMITNRNLIENSKLINECFGHEEDKSRAAIWLPPYHDMGMVGGVLQGVYSSYPTMLIPTMAFMRKQQRWLECISRYGATSSGGPNFAYELCLLNINPKNLDNIDLSSWNVAFCGAEPIRYEAMVQFSQKFEPFGFNPDAIYPCYGMAEATLMVSGKHHQKPMQKLSVDSSLLAKNVVKEISGVDRNVKNLVSSGQVHSSMKAKIVDPMLQIEKPDGEIGEVWLSGSSIAKGYWKDSEKTQALFNRKILNDDGAYHRTGDLGFIRESEIYITGRIKEVIIINGENIYPQDIEFEAKAALPDLKNCRSAAFSLSTDKGEVLALALEIPKTIDDFESIKRSINTRIVDKFGVKVSSLILLPRKIIPVTSSGKIRRSLVKNLYESNELDVYQTLEAVTEQQTKHHLIDKTQVSEASDAESHEKITEWLRSIVAHKLNTTVSNIALDDEFSSLGLDSVSAVDVLYEIEQQLNVVIPPEMLYELSSPVLLAAEIQTQLKEEEPCNVE